MFPSASGLIAIGAAVIVAASIAACVLIMRRAFDRRDALVMLYIVVTTIDFGYTVYLALAVHHFTPLRYGLAIVHRIASLGFLGCALPSLFRQPYRVAMKIVIAAALVFLDIVALPLYYARVMRRREAAPTLPAPSTPETEHSAA